MTNTVQLDSRDELAELVEVILEDYSDLAGPFDETRLPEKYVLREIDNPQVRARYLTLTVSINYKKETAGEDGIWRVCKRLLDNQPWLFDPAAVVERGEQTVVDAFDEEPIMLADDPEIWYQIAATLNHRFDGDVLAFLASNDHDAVAIREYMNEHGGEFPYLKGRKISSLWLRLMHEEVHELDNMQSIPIPVDYRIRGITARLLGEDAMAREESNDIVRSFWQSFCEEYGFVPVRIDQPLWLIEKYWDDWGNEYLHEKIGSIQ